MLSRRQFTAGLALTATGLLRPGRAGGSRDERLPPIARDGIEARLAGHDLHLSCQLPRADVERLRIDPLGAMVVVAVESRTQTPSWRRLTGAAIQRATTPVAEGKSVRFQVSVDLVRLLALPSSPAFYFVHASLLQHRSPVLALQLPA
jgi:hypothetical protein